MQTTIGTRKAGKLLATKNNSIEKKALPRLSLQPQNILPEDYSDALLIEECKMI